MAYFFFWNTGYIKGLDWKETDALLLAVNQYLFSDAIYRDVTRTAIVKHLPFARINDDDDNDVQQLRCRRG